MAEVVCDGESLTPEDVVRVAREGATVSVDPEARTRVAASRERIEDILAGDASVYGVTTGFGELVDTTIPPEDLRDLQRNLVRSHAAGAGRELRREEVRAMMLTRINALAKGYSGVRPVVLDHLATMLDRGVHPVVKSRGSLGASGDLAPLAHMALVLIGEGEAIVDAAAGGGDSGGGDSDAGDPHAGDSNTSNSDAGESNDGAGGPERLAGEDALAAAGLEPLTLEAKEGLALINGTQLSVGQAALFVVDAERTLRAADTAGALTTEVTFSTTATSDPAIHEVRPHAGQATSAANVRRLTAGSDVVASHRDCDRVQDAYSIRCLPQVHGAARDAVAHLREAVAVELNSATDNPLVFPPGMTDRDATTEDAAATVISNGNFHGEPLALRLDYATEAMVELAAIAERRVDRLLNPNVQEDHLPPFLAADSGLESGYMIAQYTAASLLAELRSIGRPATDNTPVSGGQEDHVSMSATSAFAARRALGHTRQVVAIELVCGAEAREYVDDDLGLGPGTQAAYEAVREVVPPLSGDRPIHEDLQVAAALVEGGVIDEAVDGALDEPLE